MTYYYKPNNMYTFVHCTIDFIKSMIILIVLFYVLLICMHLHICTLYIRVLMCIYIYITQRRTQEFSIGGGG